VIGHPTNEHHEHEGAVRMDRSQRIMLFQHNDPHIMVPGDCWANVRENLFPAHAMDLAEARIK